MFGQQQPKGRWEKNSWKDEGSRNQVSCVSIRDAENLSIFVRAQLMKFSALWCWSDAEVSDDKMSSRLRRSVLEEKEKLWLKLCLLWCCCAGCTWSEQPPAVVLMCGTLAIVAVALGLVVAGFAIHLKAVLRTILGRSRAILGQVTVAGWRPALTSHLFQLWVEEKKTGGFAGIRQSVISVYN